MKSALRAEFCEAGGRPLVGFTVGGHPQSAAGSFANLFEQFPELSETVLTGVSQPRATATASVSCRSTSFTPASRRRRSSSRPTATAWTSPPTFPTSGSSSRCPRRAAAANPPTRVVPRGARRGGAVRRRLGRLPQLGERSLGLGSVRPADDRRPVLAQRAWIAVAAVVFLVALPPPGGAAGASAHSCWTAASSRPAPAAASNDATAPEVLAQRLLARLGDDRYVTGIHLAPPPPVTFQHSYWRDGRPPQDALWAYIAAPRASAAHLRDADPETISRHQQAAWGGARPSCSAGRALRRGRRAARRLDRRGAVRAHQRTRPSSRRSGNRLRASCRTGSPQLRSASASASCR